MAALVAGAVAAGDDLGAGRDRRLDLADDLLAEAALTIGPMSVPGSIGSPTVSVRVWSTNALRKSS